MELKIRCEKEENFYLKPFLNFYFSLFSPSTEVIDVECLGENLPDYFLIHPRILIEVKTINYREILEETTALAKNIERLRKELPKRDLSFLTNWYSVEIPYTLRIKQGREKEIIDKLLKTIQENQPTLAINGYIFKIKKFEGIGKAIDFVSHHGGGLEISELLSKNIMHVIEKANKQFEAFKEKANKKILLIAEEYVFATDENSYLKALIPFYNQSKTKYVNIDEIWIQKRTKTNQIDIFSHKLLYSNFRFPF
jgi:hypothetical protein